MKHSKGDCVRHAIHNNTLEGAWVSQDAKFTEYITILVYRRAMIAFMPPTTNAALRTAAAHPWLIA